MTISVVGLWHLGETVAVSLAELGHRVIGLDEDRDVVAGLQKGVPPLQEPSLRDLLAKHLQGGALSFTGDFSQIKNCDAVFLTFDTPVSENDEPDVAPLFDAVKKLAPHLKTDALFVVMSQVPVGTTSKLLGVIKEVNPSLACEGVYLPENLQLGRAINCFLKPDRIVIGADTESAKERMDALLKNVQAPRLFMNVVSAEMSKHALNAYLATSLSFIYNISDMCEAVGADITDVSRAMRRDKRIGEGAYLDSSIGFSGGTLMRDLKTLASLGDLPVIAGTIRTNEERRKKILSRVEKFLGMPFAKARIGVLGVTYKPGTSTLRRSMALELLQIMRSAGAKVAACDPEALEAEFLKEAGFPLVRDPYEMARDCHGVLLVTAWPEFQNLLPERLKEVMNSPYLFFDARNFFKDKEHIFKSKGLTYVGIGR